MWGSARLDRGFGGTEGKIKRLIESISELESLSSTMTSTLEEMSERVSTLALEWVATLLGHRIIRVVSIVKSLP